MILRLLFRWVKRLAIATAVMLLIAGLSLPKSFVLAETIPLGLSPQLAEVSSFTTLIDRDLADVYVPTPLPMSTAPEGLPIALLLQGANVDKSNYSTFANSLARYGFIVVVPNHLQKFPPIPGLGKDILLPDQRQIPRVLSYMQAENANASSPLFHTIDLEKLVVIGHSMGGLAGLNAIQNSCRPPLCFGRFTRPSELVGGVFYGTNLKGHFDQQIRPIANAGIPVALIRGTLDGESTPEDTEVTYQQIQDSPKALITLKGANHYGITNTNNPVNPPGILPIQADPVVPTLDSAKSIESIARWTAAFLRANVMQDQAALASLHHSPEHDYETVLVD